MVRRNSIQMKLTINKTVIVNFVFMLLLCLNESSAVISHLISETLYSLITYSISLIAIVTFLFSIDRLPKKCWLVILVVILAVGYSFIYIENIKYILEIFSLTKFRTVWLISLLFGIQKEPRKTRNILYKCAYIILALNIYGLFEGAYDRVDSNAINYMGFGYTCAIWWAIITSSIYIDDKILLKKVFEVLTSVFVGVIVIFYGSRGAVLSMLVFLLFCFIRYYSKGKKVQLCVIFGTITAMFYFFWNQIFSIIIGLSGAIGITSRNLMLIQSSLISQDTHRFDTVYAYSIDLIKKNFLIGNGIGADRVIGGGSQYYSHNIILELCVNFGIIIGAILFIYLAYIGFKMLIISNDLDWVSYFAPFYIITMVRLMVSSSLYLVSEFWTFLFIYYTYLSIIKENNNIKTIIKRK